MIRIAGQNCIYFEPDSSGGVCNHPNMRGGFWIFSYRRDCILSYGKIECELRVPKFKSVAEIIKTSKPKPKPKRKAPHVHKKHIHKKEK